MTKVEELRLDIIQDLARLKFMEGKHKEMTWGELEHHYGYPLVDPLISAARSEGVAEGKERAKADIWKAQLYGYRVQLYPFPHDEREGLRVETEVDGKQYVMVPIAAVLASTKEKPERGKPSQALLDELSEICGGKVEYEPSVLAPTKEKP